MGPRLLAVAALVAGSATRGSGQVPACPAESTTATDAAGNIDFWWLTNTSSGYGNHMTCLWSINCTGGLRPTLTFSHFSTENNYDWLDIYDGAISDTQASYGGSHLSGSFLPSCYTASASRMDLRFTSDFSIGHHGFIASWVCQAADVATGCSTPQEAYVAELACSNQAPQALTDDAGQIDFWFAAVHYTYTHNEICHWSITCETTQVPRLAFESFHTENNFDFLDIYDGPYTGIPLTSQSNSHLSGSMMPGCYRATQQRMDIRFTSDASIALHGFLATYTCVDPGPAGSSCIVPNPYANAVTTDLVPLLQPGTGSAAALMALSSSDRNALCDTYKATQKQDACLIGCQCGSMQTCVADEGLAGACRFNWKWLLVLFAGVATGVGGMCCYRFRTKHRVLQTAAHPGETSMDMVVLGAVVAPPMASPAGAPEVNGQWFDPFKTQQTAPVHAAAYPAAP